MWILFKCSRGWILISPSAMFLVFLEHWVTLSGIIKVWCKCVEGFVVVPPAGDVSPSCVQLDAVLASLRWRGLQFIPSVFSYNTFFFGGKAPKTLLWPNLCFFAAGPASNLIHHVHPVLIDFQCTFWKGLKPSAASRGTKGAPRSPPFSTSEG